jgi:TolB protein
MTARLPRLRVTPTARLAGLTLATLLLAAAPLSAQEPSQGVRIGLTYAPGTRPGLYVLPLRGANADSIRAIITRDLDFGDRISVIAPDSGAPPVGKLNYPLYARLGAAAVLQLTLNPAGGLHVVLHEVAAGRVLNTADLPLRGAALSVDWRASVHEISDEIERWVTGMRGIAATRVIFTRGGTLWSVDSDGQNVVPVPGVGSALGPVWHPNGTTIGYTEMLDDGTRVVVRDLVRGTSRRYVRDRGTNVSPAFSPDGKQLAFASGDDGTDIYVTPLDASEAPFRVTVGRGSTNSQPTFAPDGKRIVFTTSRLGPQQLYITDSDGANPELLTTSGFGDQLYRADPSWSPDGRFVAFSTQIEGRFQIATIGLRDRAVKQHTIDGVNEDPSWAPDARHLVFTSSRTGTKQLWVLDTESGRLRQLTSGPASRMAAWSPRFPIAR